MSPHGSNIILDVRNLSAGYGELPVIRDLNLHVKEAEIVALVGSNGAGKTTFLRALSHLIHSEGQIEFCGEDVSRSTSDYVFRRGLVHIPEGRQLFDRMSVEENLLMGAYRSKDKARTKADLEKVYVLFPRLAERRKQLAGSMSGGEQQMCAMAQALMANPVLLLVDEMSLGLAPVVVDQLMTILHDIRKSEQVTVLLVEQDIHLALDGADRGYVMETGTFTLEGKAQDLIHDERVQKAYLGL
ncbi:MULTISPECIES: ABC transporter ATP-binding protein [unclassified Brucella]|uniref:ABC transporter ATP-binding protein n=1 Tax=unclassified Brucella TaxID=2632610 RepID=UPI000D040086|nr:MULTISPECIES: ABC transporter ATP-binding protein [unclassified Brucella]